MITEKDLQEAIAECQGVRKPNSDTCMKLASFYTILDHMYAKESGPNYSFAEPPGEGTNYIRPKIESYSDSEFSQLINGMYLEDVLPVIDELMDTLKVMNTRLYNGVMRKIAGL